MENEVVGTQKVRDRIAEELAEKSWAAKKDEFTEMPSETAPAAEAPETVETPAEDPAPEVTAPHEPEMVTLKVDGQEIQVPKEKVDSEGGVDALQMKLAAAKRLEEARLEAARIRDEAQREVAKAKPAEEEPNVAALVEKIRFGTEAEAAEAIRQMTKQNHVSQDAVAPIVQAEIAKSEAVRSFKNDFPDIVKDPFLSRLALDLEVSARQNGDRRSHHDLYQDIGKRITEWKGGISGSFKDKQEKKSNITVLPQAKAKAALPEEPRELTRKEILEQMRKARKQA